MGTSRFRTESASGERGRPKVHRHCRGRQTASALPSTAQPCGPKEVIRGNFNAKCDVWSLGAPHSFRSRPNKSPGARGLAVCASKLHSESQSVLDPFKPCAGCCLYALLCRKPLRLEDVKGEGAVGRAFRHSSFVFSPETSLGNSI